MGSIKDRNGMDLTEAEDTKKRGQESISEKIITKNEPKYDEKLGQKSLAGYSTWSHKELDTIGQLSKAHS